MSVKIKSVAIVDDLGEVINLSDGQTLKPSAKLPTAVLGLSVAQLFVRAEVAANGTADGDLPAQIAVEVRTHEPGSRRPGKGSVKTAYPLTLTRQPKTSRYQANLPLSRLAGFMKTDTTPEVATVVREGGTSDQKFRKTLADAGWALRGGGVQPDKGK